jgi:hypothetical protein
MLSKSHREELLPGAAREVDETSRALSCAILAAIKGHIPIVGISAHAMRSDQQRFMIAGMDACLSKPLDADSLIEVVERLAGKTRSTSAAAIQSIEQGTNESATLPNSKLFEAPGRRSLVAERSDPIFSGRCTWIAAQHPRRNLLEFEPVDALRAQTS